MPIDISQAERMGEAEAIKLADQYGYIPDMSEVKKAVDRIWNFIAGWSDADKRSAIRIAVSSAYCHLAQTPPPYCGPPMGKGEAEKVFEQTLRDNGIDPGRYRSFASVWSHVWDRVKDMHAEAQKAMFSLFAKEEYQTNPGVRAQEPARKQAAAKAPAAPPAPSPKPAPAPPTARGEDRKERAWEWFRGMLDGLIPEEEARERFEEEWPSLQNLSETEIATAYGTIAREILTERFQSAQKNVISKEARAGTPVSAAPAAYAASPQPSSPAPAADERSEELLALEYGRKESGAPASVAVALQQKLAVIATEFNNEVKRVRNGEAKAVPLEHVLVLHLLEDMGDSLIVSGWRSLLSGENQGTINDLWDVMRGFKNFSVNYGYKMDTPVKVSVGGNEEEIPAWQVVVYATIAELLKDLNLPDNYGYSYYDSVLRQMAE